MHHSFYFNKYNFYFILNNFFAFSLVASAYSKTMLVLEAIYGFGVAESWRILSRSGDSFVFADLNHAVREKIGFKAKCRLFRLWLYGLCSSFFTVLN